MLKLYVKYEQNRTICCRVIDDLAHYRREIFEGVAFPRKDLSGAWTELHQTSILLENSVEPCCKISLQTGDDRERETIAFCFSDSQRLSFDSAV